MKYIPFILIIFIIACEQVVEIELPEHDSQLVLSSFYEAGDTKVTAFLTKSLSITSLENPDDVWDASIKLYEDDVLLGDFEVGFDTTYYTSFLGVDSLGNPTFGESEIDRITRLYLLELSESLEIGKTYKMTAEAPGYESASAVQQLLPPPDILSVSYDPMSRPGLEGYVMDAFDIIVQDIPNQDNYFEFNVFIKNTYPNGWGYGEWGKGWTESFTPGVEEGNRGSLLLKDDLFDASTYNVELLMWPQDTSYVDIKIEVNMISRDKYFFSKSMQAYFNAQGNPFAEPVIVHTNVENGQGIFSIENSTEVIID